MPLKQSLASFALYSLDQNIFHHFRPVASPPKVSALERVVDKNKEMTRVPTHFYCHILIFLSLKDSFSDLQFSKIPTAIYAFVINRCFSIVTERRA